MKPKARNGLGCEERVKNGTSGNSNVNKWIKEEEGFPGGSVAQNPLLMQGAWVWSLEKKKATHSSILAWEIPWTEEPNGP